MKNKITRALTSISVSLLSILAVTGCSSNDDEESSKICGCTMEYDEEDLAAYFTYYIDPNIPRFLDWVNPNCGTVSLPSSDIEYELTGEETYQLTSQFNYFNFCHGVAVSNAKEELVNKIDKAIDIMGDYKLYGEEDEFPNCRAHFYVCQDGTVVIKDDQDWFYHWNDSGSIDYDQFEEYVLRIIGDDQ